MLKRSLSGATASLTVPAFLGQTFLGLDAHAQAVGLGPDGPILVVLQLSGGNDSLNTVVPYNGGDSAIYYAERPNLAIAPEDVLTLNGETDYGFHPSLPKLRSLWNSEELAIVNGVGYPNANLSHFTSMDFWHTAEPNLPKRDGWLGRFFDHQCSGAGDECDLLGIDAGGSGLAFQSAGADGRIGLGSPDNFRWKGSGEQRSEPAIQELYARLNRYDHSWKSEIESEKAALAYVQRTAHNALTGANSVQEAVDTGGTPTTLFPETSLGDQFKNIATLIKGGMTSSVYYVEQSGYDTHSGQFDVDGSGNPSLAGRHVDLLTELDNALDAFVMEMKSQSNWDRVLLFTFSEFGRKVIENGSRGSDHGAGSSLFVTGGQVVPGMHGTMPSLAAADRIKNESMDFSIDFRRVYRTALESWLGVPSADIPNVLPSAPVGSFSPLGFV